MQRFPLRHCPPEARPTITPLVPRSTSPTAPARSRSVTDRGAHHPSPLQKPAAAGTPAGWGARRSGAGDVPRLRPLPSRPTETPAGAPWPSGTWAQGACAREHARRTPAPGPPYAACIAPPAGPGPEARWSSACRAREQGGMSGEPLVPHWQRRRARRARRLRLQRTRRGLTRRNRQSSRPHS
jgi:hypothetical protein